MQNTGGTYIVSGEGSCTCCHGETDPAGCSASPFSCLPVGGGGDPTTDGPRELDIRCSALSSFGLGLCLPVANRCSDLLPSGWWFWVDIAHPSSGDLCGHPGLLLWLGSCTALLGLA